MKSKPKKPGSKKTSKASKEEAEGNEGSLDVSKQSLEHRINALKKIIKHLSDENIKSS